MSTKRKPLDIAAISSAAVPQPDPVEKALAPVEASAAPPSEPPEAAPPATPAAPQPRAGKGRAVAQAPSEPAKRRSPSQVARTGRVSIQGHFPDELRRSLKALAATQGRTLEELLGEGIEDLLSKYNAHPSRAVRRMQS